jgi:ATP-dependent Lon protease
MFPHVVQPLHLFEPRYVAMIEAALAGNRLIAMALLREGWPSDYAGDPPIHQTVCLGRVISDSRLEDGRYNILLAGVTRARVLRELTDEAAYRTAEIVLLPDIYGSANPLEQRQLQQRLLNSFREFYPSGATGEESLQQLLREEIPLGMLADVVAYTLPLPLEAKQQLLACQQVERRAATLIQHLQSLRKSGGEELTPPFPPPFSEN